MMAHHEFDTIVSITIGTESEHCATISGEYTPAVRAPLSGCHSDEEPAQASFYIDRVDIRIGGKLIDFLPFIDDEQARAIEAEAVADFECFAWRREARPSAAKPALALQTKATQGFVK